MIFTAQVQSAASAQSVVADIIANGGQAVAVRADTGDEASIVHLFETVDRELGPVTSVVNNAGIAQSVMTLETMDAQRLERTWEVNITGYFLCAREAI